ncbi:MAG: hypothetical protein ABSD98_03860 [Candidatus Korobacteraceae bacterium]|jgi:hypothetical protein
MVSSAKSRKKRQRQDKKRERGGGRTGSAILKGLLAPGVIIAALLLLATYKHNDADELRNTVYRPLYSELSEIQAALQQDVMLVQFATNTKNTLEQSGEWNRLPRTLRDSLQSAYSQALAAEGHLAFTEKLQRTTSERVTALRTQAEDRAWLQRTVAALNAELRARPGESGIRSFTMHHTGHSPALDIQDRDNPHYAAPGDIRWELQDWLAYPQSAKQVEAVWGDQEFLYLDDRREDWAFRITREDLRRKSLDLTTFLGPMFEIVKTGNIQDLDHRRKEAVKAIESLRTVIEGRIADPKRVGDLLEWR